MEFSFSELMVVAIACVVFLKPQDLPKVMHQVGQFAAKIKGFTNQIYDAMNMAHNLGEGKVKGDDGKFYTAYSVDDVFKFSALEESLKNISGEKTEEKKEIDYQI